MALVYLLDYVSRHPAMSTAIGLGVVFLALGVIVHFASGKALGRMTPDASMEARHNAMVVGCLGPFVAIGLAACAVVSLAVGLALWVVSEYH